MRLAGVRGARIVVAVLTTIAIVSTAFSVNVFAGDESIERDDINQKRADLSRARANGDVSPDRVVVVYSSSLPVEDPTRQQVRQHLSGQLLQSSRTLRRDVLHVSGNAAAI